MKLTSVLNGGEMLRLIPMEKGDGINECHLQGLEGKRTDVTLSSPSPSWSLTPFRHPGGSSPLTCRCRDWHSLVLHLFSLQSASPHKRQHP